MSERLKKIAEKLSERLGRLESPQDVFDKLHTYSRKIPEFFQSFPSEDYIKLVFYTYSYHQTQNFDLAQSMMNNLTFLGLLTTEGNESSFTCSYCGGEGTQNCENCDAEGEVTCDTCGGDGRVSCETCDGSGEDEEGLPCSDCQGGGELECDDCEGTGVVTCPMCGGDNYWDCSHCDGQGEISREGFVDSSIYFVCTWDKELIEDCRNSLNEDRPATSEYEFNRKTDEWIIIYRDDEAAELNDFVEINEMYCFYMNDEPKLRMRNESWGVIFIPPPMNTDNYVEQWGA